MDDTQTFRSPFAVVIWWAWVLFAVANLIDLAVQGRDHFSVVAAFILVFITGVVYTTAQRPRIIAGDDGVLIVNPLREHRIGWAAVAAVEATELLRVRCEWPPSRGQAVPGKRLVYSWAVHSSRRRQVTAQLRSQRPRLRPERTVGGGGPYGAFAANDDADNQPPTVGDVGTAVAALSARAEGVRAADPDRQAAAPVSSWSRLAIAAIVIPALALVVAILV